MLSENSFQTILLMLSEKKAEEIFQIQLSEILKKKILQISTVHSFTEVGADCFFEVFLDLKGGEGFSLRFPRFL